jgi:DivIVA domain-containing protein
MLTPQEISGKEFVKAVFGGYDMSAVDDFLETLTADYSALYKENAILKSKIKVLVEKVEEYRSTDDAMRMALLTAQRMSEEITAEAKKKSEEMLKKADRDVRDRQHDISSKFAEEQGRLQSLKSETIKYIRASQEILRQHSQFLTKLEEVSNEIDVPVSERADEYHARLRNADNETAAATDSDVFSISDPNRPVFEAVQERRVGRRTGFIVRRTGRRRADIAAAEIRFQ